MLFKQLLGRGFNLRLLANHEADLEVSSSIFSSDEKAGEFIGCPSLAP
jgi:hypothetical protein